MGRSKKLLALGIVCSLLLGGCGKNTQTSTESSPEPKAATEAASEQNQEKAGNHKLAIMVLQVIVKSLKHWMYYLPTNL